MYFLLLLFYKKVLQVGKLYRSRLGAVDWRAQSSARDQYQRGSSERAACPPPPLPEPPKPKDDSLFWGGMTLLFIAGGFGVYAKRTPEVRDWITIYAPFFDDLIAIVYQENMTYSEFAKQCVQDIKLYAVQFFQEEPKKCIDGKPMLTSGDGALAESIEDDDEDDDDDEEEDEEEEVTTCESLPPPAFTQDVCEIEACLKEVGDIVLNNYITARDACVYYNKLVAETMEDFSMAAMKTLHEAKAERAELVAQSLLNLKEAQSLLDDLDRYIECGVRAPKDAMANLKLLFEEYKHKIKSVRLEYEWENDKTQAVDRQWPMVEDLMDNFVYQNQAMFPELKYSSDNPRIEGDADLLLTHAFKYMNKLKKDVKESQDAMTERVNRGLETLPQDEYSVRARNKQIQYEFKARMAEVDRDFRNRSENQRANNECIIKKCSNQQLERHQENLTIKLKQKEIEATKKLNKLVAEKVATERAVFKRELDEMARKLQIIQEKLNAHLKAERESRLSQELWSAGASLLAATKAGGPFVNIRKELEAIEKASDGNDELVLTVLKSIPESVRSQGVVPESELKQRYHTMERTALQVALVEQDGAPLPIYLLSFLQWLLLSLKIQGIPQAEVDKPLAEPFPGLDTFDLMQRARFWVQRGELSLALRHLSSVVGASGAVAGPWAQAARDHLHLRQAAQALLAHAKALALQHL